jgi:hypothetical protein
MEFSGAFSKTACYPESPGFPLGGFLVTLYIPNQRSILVFPGLLVLNAVNCLEEVKREDYKVRIAMSGE